MANINKFSPTSPDTFLKQESDMALAKFGHINAIVDAYNTLDTAVSAALKPVVNITTATYTATAAQSGAQFTVNKDGTVITLPTPTIGLVYEFFVNTTGAVKITTSGSTIFLIGTLVSGLEATTPSSTAGPKLFTGNGTSHISIDMNKTTTGGIAGTYIKLVCSSATLWNATGTILASGNIATPFAIT
jgi:hypothetical protein